MKVSSKMSGNVLDNVPKNDPKKVPCPQKKFEDTFPRTSMILATLKDICSKGPYDARGHMGQKQVWHNQ